MSAFPGCGAGAVASGLLVLMGANAGFAQPAPVPFDGVPEQIHPTVSEVGAPVFRIPGGSSGSGGSVQAGPAGQGNGLGIGGSNANGSAYDTLAAQSYGSAAIETSQRLGVNPNVIAAFAQIESGFQNVETVNGSSSATGPWQITSATWNHFVQQYNLPYTAADRTNPVAQANVAPYIIRDYANAVQDTTGTPVTAAQAYGAFLLGPGVGGPIARAQDGEPLSAYASAQQLSNNNLTGLTVGQFNALVSSRLGSAAQQIVVSS